MLDRPDLVYHYDGTLAGFLCCIFESFQRKERPYSIQPAQTAQMTLLKTRTIETDHRKAERVRLGICKKASRDVYDMVEFGFYTRVAQRERLVLDFVRMGMKDGKRVLSMLTNDTVHALHSAVNALVRESHQYKGFVRFSVYDGVLVAGIQPKNYVLPLLAPHFCDRYANEAFMIYDMTHNDALLYKPHESVILPIFAFVEPEADEDELRFRSLWRLFYQTIAIKERNNPACRMTHMQKRYWKQLTELNGSEREQTKNDGRYARLPCAQPAANPFRKPDGL